MNIAKLREHYGTADYSGISQPELDELFKQLFGYKQELMPDENDEKLVLVDSSGKRTGLQAPRWICHLLGFRHLCVHVAVKWRKPQPPDFFIFQIRSWNKFDSPGQVDISVSGHVTDDMPSFDAAQKEMKEELGLSLNDLVSQRIHFIGAYEKYDQNPDLNFYNREYKEVYMGEINTPQIDAVHFNDNEVVGLYLCPETELTALSLQKQIPLASGLKGSLKLLKG